MFRFSWRFFFFSSSYSMMITCLSISSSCNSKTCWLLSSKRRWSITLKYQVVSNYSKKQKAKIYKIRYHYIYIYIYRISHFISSFHHFNRLQCVVFSFFYLSLWLFNAQSPENAYVNAVVDPTVARLLILVVLIHFIAPKVWPVDEKIVLESLMANVQTRAHLVKHAQCVVQPINI